MGGDYRPIAVIRMGVGLVSQLDLRWGDSEMDN